MLKSCTKLVSSGMQLRPTSLPSYTSRIALRSLSTSAASKPVGARPNIAKSRQLAPISITPKAAERIKELIDGKKDTVGVHLSVKRRGCNGYSYIMNYASKEQVDAGKDEIVNENDVTVLVDPKAVFFLVGTSMDWNETELASEFTFINPNIKGECGCGESFNM